MVTGQVTEEVGTRQGASEWSSIGVTSEARRPGGDNLPVLSGIKR
jgi:hypothetical protein